MEEPGKHKPRPRAGKRVVMGKAKSAAVEKAKRQGAKKTFYVTGPTGWNLAMLLPKVDMVARLFSDLFAEQKIPLQFYQEQQNRIYSYVEGVDDWVSRNSEILLQAGFLKNAGSDYLNLYKSNIKKKRTVYLNTKIALNAFYSFVQCDALSALQVLALRSAILGAPEHKKSSREIFKLIDQLDEDIADMRNFICECRK